MRRTLLPSRTELEQRWLHLTRVELPQVADGRGWPIRNDHCFQRVLLDAACGGCWYDHIAQRPAYRMAADETLQHAVHLGEQALSGAADMSALNRQSLAWRGRGH